MLFNPSSPCYFLTVANEQVHHLFEKHGLKTGSRVSSWSVKRRQLVVHLLLGGCASSSLEACKSVAVGRSSTTIQRDIWISVTNTIGTHCLTESSFRSLCLLMGINSSYKSSFTDLFKQLEVLMTSRPPESI